MENKVNEGHKIQEIDKNKMDEIKTGNDQEGTIAGPTHVSSHTPQPSLKAKTVSGVKWQMVNKITQRLISVATFAILARLLSPSTFGLFAMAFILIDGLHLFKSFGVDTALVQKKDNIEEASHTAYFLVQLTGFIPAIMAFFSAPFVAHFFNKPELLNITRALGVMFIFNSFAKIPLTILTREMKFNRIAVIELVGAVVNSAVAIIYAWISPSVWALVAAYLARQIVMALLSRRLSDFRLKWQFDWKIAKELYSYGKFIVGLGILYYAYESSSNIIIGKILGAVSLGYYALAANIGNFINTNFNYLVQGVLFPAYAKLQHDKEELKRVYLKTVKTIAVVSFPFCVLLFCGAEDIVHIMYGSKWIAVVPLIKLFAVVQLVIPIMSCSDSLFNGCGHPQYNFRIIGAALLVKLPLMFYLGKNLGIKGVIISEIIIQMLLIPVNFKLVQKIIPVRWRELGVQLLTVVPASIGLGAIYLILRNLLISGHQYPLLVYALLITLTFCLAGSVCLLLFYYQDRNLFNELKGFLPKINRNVPDAT